MCNSWIWFQELASKKGTFGLTCNDRHGCICKYLYLLCYESHPSKLHKSKLEKKKRSKEILLHAPKFKVEFGYIYFFKQDEEKCFPQGLNKFMTYINLKKVNFQFKTLGELALHTGDPHVKITNHTTVYKLLFWKLQIIFYSLIQSFGISHLS